MMTMRCTRKLLSRLPHTPVDESRLPTTALGDWYANLLVVKPRWVLLCVSERSLLSVLIPAREFASVAERFRQAVDQRLRVLEIEDAARAGELRAMKVLEFGPTASRSTVGSLNELRFFAREMLADGEPDLDAIAGWLGEVPMTRAPGHWPANAARSLLARPRAALKA